MMVELIATWSGANLHPAQTHSCSLAWSSSWMAATADLTVARNRSKKKLFELKWADYLVFWALNLTQWVRFLAQEKAYG